MKRLVPIIVLALTACATVRPLQQQKPVDATVYPTTPAMTTRATVTITGDELIRTGRPELGDALRASSPIFH